MVKRMKFYKTVQTVVNCRSDAQYMPETSIDLRLLSVSCNSLIESNDLVFDFSRNNCPTLY